MISYSGLFSYYPFFFVQDYVLDNCHKLGSFIYIMIYFG